MFGLLQLYIEGYIQAMLDTVYRQEYLRVRVIDNQVRAELWVHIDGEVCIGDFLSLTFMWKNCVFMPWENTSTLFGMKVEAQNFVLRMMFVYMCMI